MKHGTCQHNDERVGLQDKTFSRLVNVFMAYVLVDIDIVCILAGLTCGDCVINCSLNF